MQESPPLYRRISIPEPFLTEGDTDQERLRYGGDVRIGDLTGNSEVDFIVYRCEPDSGLKPCFIGAFDMRGVPLWQAGNGGVQPLRPGPVAVHDIDGDGRTEVVCFFHDARAGAASESMADVVVQIRDGASGEVKREAAPAALRVRRGEGANWVHQRLLVANLRGLATPRDFVVKLGDTVLAFDDALNVLWTYTIPWNTYGACASYIPAVGDIDEDGRDEVCGGYFLLDEDGRPLWEKQLAPHMDSVAITEWDHGCVRAICSGGGHVMDADGEAVLALGTDVVPHGQEVRVARFIDAAPARQMVIRHEGHSPDAILVDSRGVILRRITLNSTPNETGMEPVCWRGSDTAALLCNGGWLFDLAGSVVLQPPDLPTPCGDRRQGWHHCIPANVCGDDREEMVLYNPWSDAVYIYTPPPLDETAFGGYRPGPRQYNPRLMD